MNNASQKLLFWGASELLKLAIFRKNITSLVSADQWFMNWFKWNHSTPVASTACYFDSRIGNDTAFEQILKGAQEDEEPRMLSNAPSSQLVWEDWKNRRPIIDREWAFHWNDSVRNFQLNVFVCSRAATIRELFLNDFLNRIIGLGDL